LETETEFHSWLTGCKNVYLNGAMLGMTDESVDQITQELHGHFLIVLFGNFKYL